MSIAGRGRPSAAAGQLDDVLQGATQLLAARPVSVLLQRPAEHVPAAQTAPRLRRLQHAAVSQQHHEHGRRHLQPSGLDSTASGLGSDVPSPVGGGV